MFQVPRPIYYIPQAIQRQLFNNMLQSLQNNSTPSAPHSLASDIEDLEPITQLSPKRGQQIPLIRKQGFKQQRHYYKVF